MATKIITDKVRFCFPNIFTPKAFGENKPEYSIVILIPEDNKKMLNKIRAAIKEALQEGVEKYNWSKVPSNYWNPLREGSEKADDYPEYEGHYFLTCKNKTMRPGIVDADKIEIIDPNEIYPGCYGRVSINFYPYEKNGSKGVAVGLNNVQKLCDGERLGAAIASAEDDFDDDYEDYEEEL